MTAPIPDAPRVPIGPDGIDAEGRPTYGGLRKWQPAADTPRDARTTAADMAPCPFCGAQCDVVGFTNGTRWRVECDKSIDHVSTWHPTKADAISAWNARPTPAVPAAE